jgi:hypothetical protein
MAAGIRVNPAPFPLCEAATTFVRMIAEVSRGKAGAAAACQVLRFARNSRNRQQLVEMCRVVDTLLVDQEVVHTPRQ